MGHCRRRCPMAVSSFAKEGGKQLLTAYCLAMFMAGICSLNSFSRAGSAIYSHRQANTEVEGHLLLSRKFSILRHRSTWRATPPITVDARKITSHHRPPPEYHLPLKKWRGWRYSAALTRLAYVDLPSRIEGFGEARDQLDPFLKRCRGTKIVSRHAPSRPLLG